ncbi:unnamed protein product [Phaedon cochleariae]|uniref:Cytochrome P450 n=1 Tax=Phaedon cochleariae TaxID=80249 RepID=A0A9P0DJC2_PHACE|nr:unnamed protein product [Phaedon cochleariae]
MFVVYIIAAIPLLLYLFSKWRYTYWSRRGIDNPEPDLFYGNFKKNNKEDTFFGYLLKECYDKYKAQGKRHFGIFAFLTPVYIPIDLESIKNILQNDADHFKNHGTYFNEDADPLRAHLFNLENDRWKNLRAKLSPTFTSGQIKMMFHTMVDCTKELKIILDDQATSRNPIDIKDVLARLTTDTIGSVAFGVNCNSLKNPDSEFRQYGKMIFEGTPSTKFARIVANFIPKWLFTKAGFKIMDKDVEDFFYNLVKDTTSYREQNNIFRKDFLHLLIQLKNFGKIREDGILTNKETTQSIMTFDEMAAQCYVFFIAGFETSASTMTFALLELALNEDIQDRLRQNINNILKKHNNNLTYEAVMEMDYLEKVIQETLRKHPPGTVLPRICNKAYNAPNSDLVIQEGTRVFIPAYAIHRDPEYFPDPKKFDPERFSDGNKQWPPFAFMPFGLGPRTCIGSRFGKMQAKVGLLSIINNFRVTLNERTKLPITYSSALIPTVKGGVWLNIEQI